MAPLVNCYSILGVQSTADAKAIKTAYKAKALQHHPDKNPLDGKAQARFVAVQDAWEILSDPEKKAKHDRTWGPRSQMPPAAPAQKFKPAPSRPPPTATGPRPGSPAETYTTPPPKSPPPAPRKKWTPPIPKSPAAEHWYNKPQTGTRAEPNQQNPWQSRSEPQQSRAWDHRASFSEPQSATPPYSERPRYKGQPFSEPSWQIPSFPESKPEPPFPWTTKPRSRDKPQAEAKQSQPQSPAKSHSRPQYNHPRELQLEPTPPPMPRSRPYGPKETRTDELPEHYKAYLKNMREMYRREVTQDEEELDLLMDQLMVVEAMAKFSF